MVKAGVLYALSYVGSNPTRSTSFESPIGRSPSGEVKSHLGAVDDVKLRIAQIQGLLYGTDAWLAPRQVGIVTP